MAAVKIPLKYSGKSFMQRMLPLMLKDTATFHFYRRKRAVTPAVRVLCNGAQVFCFFHGSFCKFDHFGDVRPTPYTFLCRLNECSWRHIAIQILPCVRSSVRPLKFRLTFFKLLLFEQVRFNYNQTWIIGALWEPSHYDALGGHMTRSKVIWGQIVCSSVRPSVKVSVNLFQIAPVRTGSLKL